MKLTCYLAVIIVICVGGFCFFYLPWQEKQILQKDMGVLWYAAGNFMCDADCVRDYPWPQSEQELIPGGFISESQLLEIKKRFDVKFYAAPPTARWNHSGDNSTPSCVIWKLKGHFYVGQISTDGSQVIQKRNAEQGAAANP